MPHGHGDANLRQASLNNELTDNGTKINITTWT